MFTKIKNPENGENVSILSTKGKKILKQYAKTVKKQKGGGWGIKVTEPSNVNEKQSGGNSWGPTNTDSDE